jgi:hypothetical protein
MARIGGAVKLLFATLLAHVMAFSSLNHPSSRH